MLNPIQQPETARAPVAADADTNHHGRPVAHGRAAEHPPSRSTSGELTLSELAWALAERRWSIAVVAGAALALALAYLVVTPNTYESSILIQVEGRSRPVTAFEDLAALFQEQTPTEGEMRIMRSRTLLEDVVEELRLDLKVRPRTIPLVGEALVRRHRGPGLAPAPFGLERFAWGGEGLVVTTLTVSEALLGEPLVVTALETGYRVSAKDGKVLGEGQIGETFIGVDGARRVELLISELTARPETEFTIEKRRPIDVIEDLQKSLRISEQGRHTGLVEVALAGRDPMQIAAILDEVSTTYRRQSVERTSAEAAKTLAVLEAQLPVLKRNLEKAERSLNAFHRKNGTANLSLGGEGLLERLADVDRAIAENEVQLAELTHRYTGKHPDLSVITERNRRLQAQRAAIEARMKGLPQLELDSTRLTRELRVATELYMLVLNRAEELRIVKSGWIGHVRVLERAAVPHNPTSPRRGIVLALGAILGIAGGIGLALVRNAVDRGAKDPMEIESGAGVAVLATIPLSAAERRLGRAGRRGRPSALSAVDPGDPAVEDLRGLRTSIQFALRAARNNVVCVSSLAPGAGKSFVSVNLAHLLAAADGRVLLVDGDLRRGGLHRYFGLEAEPGLAEVVSGAIGIDAAVRATHTPKLDLLPRGTLPENPADLLAGDRLKQLLPELGLKYSVIVVDTPPILSVSDFALVGRHAGVNLLVVRAGEHSVGEISYVAKRLLQDGVAVRGLVLNGLRPWMGRHGRGGRYRSYKVTAA